MTSCPARVILVRAGIGTGAALARSRARALAASAQLPIAAPCADGDGLERRPSSRPVVELELDRRPIRSSGAGASRRQCSSSACVLAAQRVHFALRQVDPPVDLPFRRRARLLGRALRAAAAGRGLLLLVREAPRPRRRRIPLVGFRLGRGVLPAWPCPCAARLAACASAAGFRLRASAPRLGSFLGLGSAAVRVGDRAPTGSGSSAPSLRLGDGSLRRRSRCPAARRPGCFPAQVSLGAGSGGRCVGFRRLRALPPRHGSAFGSAPASGRLGRCRAAVADLFGARGTTIGGFAARPRGFRRSAAASCRPAGSGSTRRSERYRPAGLSTSVTSKRLGADSDNSARPSTTACRPLPR